MVIVARLHLARGVGFEPTRPLRTTGLAGLPPTRLGQPRLDYLKRLLNKVACFYFFVFLSASF
jgi:hypothetical protein